MLQTAPKDRDRGDENRRPPRQRQNRQEREAVDRRYQAQENGLHRYVGDLARNNAPAATNRTPPPAGSVREKSVIRTASPTRTGRKELNSEPTP